ncbi:MAG: DNA repair protein RecO [Clostridia bacterium]|nr:DNA repair protein RecO [Clostridia bacterium]
MKIKTEALVIREKSIGDNDRLVTLMTDNMGIINAFAVGAKSIKSRRGAASSLLSFSDFTLDKKKDSYKISEASIKRVFFDVGSDIESLSLAQYFCELSEYFYPFDEYSKEFLRLILNSLHFITTKEKSLNMIKAITELKIAAISGYEPNLISCSGCGKFEDSSMFFNLSDGSLYCSSCADSGGMIQLSPDILKAMRHILYSDFSKIYSFSLSENNMKTLSKVTERYILYHAEKNFKTLDFYNSIKQ